METPFADDVPCFKTGRSSPDAWIDKAIAEIAKAGGQIVGHAFGNDVRSGRAAFMLEFTLADDRFRITWPVLPVKREGDEWAAKIQAATLIYHDVKAKCVKARVFGPRTAFFEHLLLPDGREAHHVATPELLDALPEIVQPRRIGQK